MGIRIGRWTFQGPYTSPDSLEDRPGVYAVLDSAASQYSLLDCGESATVKTRLEAHDRADCWARTARGRVVYAALYTPNLRAPDRREIEREIREQYSPPCGDR
ncbi:MAG: hypothetical protein GXP27_05245 [Planctomycetes bacterium]|nr:hypothetical protein [Planctomycetota bacterium]